MYELYVTYTGLRYNYGPMLHIRANVKYTDSMLHIRAYVKYTGSMLHIRAYVKYTGSTLHIRAACYIYESDYVMCSNLIARIFNTPVFVTSPYM